MLGHQAHRRQGYADGGKEKNSTLLCLPYIDPYTVSDMLQELLGLRFNHLLCAPCGFA
jgi:hypothetical protein